MNFEGNRMSMRLGSQRLTRQLSNNANLEVPEVEGIVETPYIEDVRNHYRRLKAFPKERASSVSELAHLAWNGGEGCQTFIGKVGLIDMLVDYLRAELESLAVKKKTLQALSVIVRNNRFNQDRFRGCGGLRVLADMSMSDDADVRRWSVHTMFFALVANAVSQEEVLEIDQIEGKLTYVAQDNWALWSHNDANELLKMLGFLAIKNPRESAANPTIHIAHHHKQMQKLREQQEKAAAEARQQSSRRLLRGRSKVRDGGDGGSADDENSRPSSMASLPEPAVSQEKKGG